MLSHIGVNNNIYQPSKSCLFCKYWMSATKRGYIGGHCRSSYCRKNENKKGQKKRNGYF